MIRGATAILLAILAAQDPSDADPEARLRSIESLAARGDPGKTEGWPAFYREALKASARARESLKGVAKPERRIRVEGKETTVGEALADLSRSSGVEFDVGSMRGEFQKQPLTLKAGESTPMEALADLCRAAELWPSERGGTPAIALMKSAKPPLGPFAAGHFGIFHYHVSARERIDFGEPPERIARIRLLVYWDRELDVATIRKSVRLVEATSDTGENLVLSTRREATSVRESEEWAGYVSKNRNRELDIPIVLPSLKTAKITRLRFVASALVPRRIREYAIDQPEHPEKGRAADEDFEITMLETKGIPTERKSRIRVRPLKMKPEALAELPLTFKVTYEGAADGQTWFRPTVVSGAVEYVVWWYPMNHYDAKASSYGTEVLSAKVSIPVSLEEWPIFAEFRDIPLK